MDVPSNLFWQCLCLYEHELNRNFKSLLRRLINCDEIRLCNTFGSKLDEMPAD